MAVFLKIKERKQFSHCVVFLYYSPSEQFEEAEQLFGSKIQKCIQYSSYPFEIISSVYSCGCTFDISGFIC